jgi:hypothetical protein
LDRGITLRPQMLIRKICIIMFKFFVRRFCPFPSFLVSKVKFSLLTMDGKKPWLTDWPKHGWRCFYLRLRTIYVRCGAAANLSGMGCYKHK